MGNNIKDVLLNRLNKSKKNLDSIQGKSEVVFLVLSKKDFSELMNVRTYEKDFDFNKRLWCGFPYVVRNGARTEWRFKKNDD